MMSNETISVPPHIGLEPLVGLYYPARCRRCGWVGSSEELTEDDAQCTRDIGDRLCLGDCDELDSHDLLGIIQAMAKHQGEPVARMPVERSYDVRAQMIIAFNETKKAGGDLDDALDAAYKSALRYSPNPMMRDEQHQGEPVAWVELDDSMPHGKTLDWYQEDIKPLPLHAKLYTRPGAQHQGEPAPAIPVGVPALLAEIERLKGLRPEAPPRPPEGKGLPRYGLRWNGPQQPLATPMDDGYWTPWHLANELRKDAERYQWLRSRDLETISQGGVFAGITPENQVLNEETLDDAIDAAMAHEVQP
ncbi:hypothetical protein H7A76_24475 [Pseudomonas sp. MSSRFD41]|uniref:hypothetical protein n=1 Tax=Pseudomonas sp. MSSRFD41 TaxID=1310370 RepID=UPI0016399ABB|nr:hypothetical protein [Pseudomonas sp. MSSRFD41]MBC2658606.1 hypothetical protein [Pseudomonas sp. MSSRFD41]